METENSEKNEFSFVFQQSYFETALMFSGKDFEKFLSLLIKYGLYGEKPDFSGLSQRGQLAASTSFVQIRQRIDASKRRYQAAVENGKRGGRPRKTHQKPDVKPEQIPEPKPVQKAEKYQNGNQTQNLNINSNDNTLGNYHYLKESSSPTGGVEAPPPSNPTDEEALEAVKAEVYAKFEEVQRQEAETKAAAEAEFKEAMLRREEERAAEKARRAERFQELLKAKGEEVDAC